MLNEKIIFSLINRQDYEALCYLHELLSNADKRMTNTLCRNRDISDQRKVIIKLVKDKFPKCDNKLIANKMKCTANAVKQSYIAANILYSNNPQFQMLFDQWKNQ